MIDHSFHTVFFYLYLSRQIIVLTNQNELKIMSLQSATVFYEKIQFHC